MEAKATAQQFHNLSQLEAAIKLSGEAILSLCERGLLPKPIKLPDGDIAWKVSDMNFCAKEWVAIVAAVNKSNREN